MLGYFGKILLADDYHDRPDSQQLLDETDNWFIDIEDVKNDKNYEQDYSNLVHYSEHIKFFQNYIDCKLQ